MSSYRAEAVNPATGEVQMAEFLDDYFGPRQYGVRFPGSPHVYRLGDILSAENPEDDDE